VIGPLPWVDAALLAVLLGSVLLGLARGVTYELMGLAGWVVAYFAAAWLAPQAAPHIPVGMPDSALNQSAALVLCFVVVLVAWGLLARVLRLLIKATPLSFLDRVLGAVFGALRGAVLLLLVATVVALTPAAQSPSWQASTAAPVLLGAVKGVKTLLPPALARWLPG
jgi:membrane protein required for colicin V production